MKHSVKLATVARSRTIEHIITGVETSDGAGVKLTRVLTQNLQQRLDPFLMLDNFHSDDPDDYIAGFPDHPHRGFETVTYMIAGRMRHRDNAGHEGLLQNGGVQWMTAGRGIIHSEMPEQENGVMEGFQLWLNLPARRKMIPAWYRDIPKAEIPEYVTEGGVTVRVIAGTSNGVAGAMTREDTEPLYIDIELPAGSTFSTMIPATHNAFVYVYRGSVTISGTTLGENRMGILSNSPQACPDETTDSATSHLTNPAQDAGQVIGYSHSTRLLKNDSQVAGYEPSRRADGVTLSANVPAKAILISGKPLGEPIMQHGPFVMNTKEEIYQAIRDYQEGRLGGAG